MRVIFACFLLSLLVGAVVAGPTAAESKESSTTDEKELPGVEGTLSPGADPTRPYVLTFTLKNAGQTPFTFLRWNSPFDTIQATSLFTLLPRSADSGTADSSGKPGPFLKKIVEELKETVSAIGDKLKELAESAKLVPYTGPEVERDEDKATPEDFITMKPGETKTAQVDLLKNYAMTKGSYLVKIDFSIVLVNLVDNKINSTSLYPLEGQMNVDIEEPSPSYAHFLKSGISKTGAETSTAGLALLEMQNKDKRAHSKERVGATTYTGCDAKLVEVQAAVAKAKTMLQDSKAYLNRQCTWDVRVQKFFGKDSAAARQKVNKMIDDITGKIDSVEVKCCDDGTLCSDGSQGETPTNCDAVAYAWRFYYPNTIHLCTQAWLRKSTTHTYRGSRASTIIHEISHLFSTKDHGYQEKTIFPMAYEDQAKALNNADTYALFHSFDDAFPGACNTTAPDVSACVGLFPETYVSDPIDDCEELFKSTYNHEVTLKKVGDNTKTMKKTVAASTKGPNLRWGPARGGIAGFFGIAPHEVKVRGTIATQNRKCCVVACAGTVWDDFQVFARDAGKNTCAATPSE